VPPILRKFIGQRDRCMKPTTDQRAASLLLWIFAISAMGQLALHYGASHALEEVHRLVGVPNRLHTVSGLLMGVRDDLLSSSLLAILGLALGLLEFKALSRRLNKRQLTALAASESELFARSTVDALTSQIAILDHRGTVLAANRMWRDFGERVDIQNAPLYRTLEGSNYLVDCDLLAGRGCIQATAIGNAIRAVTGARQEVAMTEYWAVPSPSANGIIPEAVWFMVTVTRFPGEGPLRVVVAHEDITPRKKAEADLHRAAEAAEAANRAKSDFLANMSHEIRTPMTAILGYADMLQESAQTPAERNKAVQTIRRNGEHLLGIINDILDVSKIEADHMTTERVPCDIRQILADVVSLVGTRAFEKKLDFRVIVDGRIPVSIQTDPLRLKQILVNLVGNAIKFTRKGHVLIRASCEDSLQGGTMRFDICDTGIGMTEEQQSKVFAAFTQADGSTSRRFGGTGLGLTISKRLAILLGGDIHVRSIAGKGSTFSASIDAGPLAGIEMISELPEDLDSGIAMSERMAELSLNGRILLVEDGIDNQELLSTHLRQAGAEVAIAGNGRVAVDMASGSKPTEQFDLILMDMQMPELDGYEATRELRKLGNTRPIIALTAHAIADERPKCIAAGCTDFLGKPITRDQLISAVARYLPTQPSTQKPVAKPVAPSAASERVTIDSNHSAKKLRSSYGDNPKMEQVLTRFVARLPDRVTQIQKMLVDEDLDAIKQAAHQLKGAAGGYGFAELTDAAGRVEARIKTHDAFDAITQEVQSLLSLITQVEGYSTGGPGKHTQRVLMIDDDISIHELIRASLTGDPVEVDSVYDGRTAMAQALVVKPDLILLDLELSSTHGFDVCRQLKSDPSIAAVPVIFITSTAGTAEKIQGLSLGAIDYITKPFDPGEARARILAALRVKQLQDQLARNANVDVLTGVGNRRYFDQRAATELSRSRRQSQPLACVMLDLDHFKSINDTHGHPFGDEVLRRMGQLLTETVRTEDIACRYGGEEFVILAPGLERHAAVALAERLRLAVEGLQMLHEGNQVNLTCSFGVAEVDSGMHASADLVHRADMALYEAKRGGRNRVVSLPPREDPAAHPGLAESSAAPTRAA
jgi:diguanylate cyclase (GGDEF)-like protein